LLWQKGKGLVIESLNFIKKNKGKQFNRIINNFVYRKLLESIERKAIRCGVRLFKVNPAYTSIIGKYKYATSLGLSFHQAAAFVIARRGLGFRERIIQLEAIWTNRKKVDISLYKLAEILSI